MSGDVVDRAALEHLLTEGIKDYLSESCRTRIVNVILNAGFQRASLARQTDGLAWLIERGQAENQRPTLYWTGTTDHADQKYDGIWTEDVNGAHKYASKQAAQTALDASYLAALGRDAAGAHVAEHLWMAGDPLPRQTIEGEPTYLDAWPLRDAVRRLVEAADHLFYVHDCDHHDYEELICARDAAKEWLSANHPEVAQRTIEGAMLAVKQAGIEAAVVVLQESLDDRERLRALVHSQAAKLAHLKSSYAPLHEKIAEQAATIAELDERLISVSAALADYAVVKEICAEQAATVTALQHDAARYRYVRQRITTARYATTQQETGLTPEQYDASIDTAMQLATPSAATIQALQEGKASPLEHPYPSSEGATPDGGPAFMSGFSHGPERP